MGLKDDLGWRGRGNYFTGASRGCGCLCRKMLSQGELMRSNGTLETRSTSQEGTAAARKLKVAVIGFGTVGRSVAKLLCKDTGGQLQLTHICNRNIERKRVDWLPAHICWTESIEQMLSSEVDVVVELIGGLQPAGEWIRKALQSGKSVVTANKHLIAECGSELMELAQENGRRIEFGAAVAGGIPVLTALQEGLAGDRLYKIAGILNGTCNYILSSMEATGVSFAAALQEAQDLGFAEADPRDDLEGFDARSKLIILARAGMQYQLRSDQVLCRSISSIEPVDFVYARELNGTIRQISLAQKDRSNGSLLFASVQPALIPTSSPLARIQGNQNLVLVAGEFVGEVVFSGHGAGGEPTAVAVVSDLLSIARNKTTRPAWTPTAIEFPEEVSGELTLPHYLRFIVKDRPGIIAAIATILSEHSINIDSVLQKPGYPHSRLPFVITLESCSSAAMNSALEEICDLDFHVQTPICLPILPS